MVVFHYLVLGRELKIKGILTLFHGRIDSLPLTKRLVGGGREQVILVSPFLERFRQKTVIWKNNPMYDFENYFRW